MPGKSGPRHDKVTIAKCKKCGILGKIMHTGICYECNRREIDKRYYAKKQLGKSTGGIKP